jgi:hypothetical protein
MLTIVLNTTCPIALRSLLGLDMLDDMLANLFDATLWPTVSLALMVLVLPLARLLERLLGAAPSRAGPG